MRKALGVTFGTTGQLLPHYQVPSAVYTVISTPRDRTSDHRAETLPPSHWSTSHRIDSKLPSHGKYATT